MQDTGRVTTLKRPKENHLQQQKKQTNALPHTFSTWYEKYTKRSKVIVDSKQSRSTENQATPSSDMTHLTVMVNITIQQYVSVNVCICIYRQLYTHQLVCNHTQLTLVSHSGPK